MNSRRFIPAESANGRFAMKAMQAVPMNDARQVARRTAVLSIPVVESTLGFTASMYAIVMNVVRPAASSVLTVVLFSFSLNNFSNIFTTPILQILLCTEDFCNTHCNPDRIL